MDIFNYVFISFVAISILIVLFFAIRTKKFFKTILTSSIIGVITLLILHFTSKFTGFNIELTPYTLGFSSIFGLPGVVATVICKMIFGL